MNEKTPILCRRNLMIMSALIMFYYYAGVSLSGVKILGAIITFQNINAVEHSLWGIFIYAYLRYLLIYVSSSSKEYNLVFMKKIRDSINIDMMKFEPNVYRDIKGDDFLLNTVIEVRRGDFNGNILMLNVGSLPKIVRKALSKATKRKIYTGQKVLLNLIYSYKELNIAGINEPRFNWLFKFLIEYVLGFRFWGYNWNACTYHMRKEEVSRDQSHGRMSLSGWETFKVVLKAHLKVIFTTSEFMEHQLPLLIGIFPVLFYIIYGV